MMDMTKEEYIVFIREAVQDRESDAHLELYNFLLTCFCRADVTMEGRIYEGGAA